MDKVEDYIRYDITLPAELREEYQRLLKSGWASNKMSKENEKEMQKQLIENLLYRNWADRLDWWGLPKPKKLILKTIQLGNKNKNLLSNIISKIT